MNKNNLAIAYAAKRRAKYGSAKPPPQVETPPEVFEDEEAPIAEEPKKVNIAEIVKSIRNRK